MTWFYLFIAVLAQDGTAHITYGFPYTTREGCQENKAYADAKLLSETMVKKPENAGQFRTICVPVNFEDNAAWAPPGKHIPGKDEA